MRRSRSGRVIAVLAEATGRTDEEVRLALTLAATGAAVLGALRILNRLEDLEVHVFGYSSRGP